jgi:toxin-antitoxin system PIN domain toxin
VILVDANLLIYAVNRDASNHKVARSWLEKALSDAQTVGMTWGVMLAFLRITTRPGILDRPLENDRALAFLDDWVGLPSVEIVSPGEGHWRILRDLLAATGTLGNLTSDAHLAAMSIENGATIYSADYDFRRFPGVKHVNPLQAQGR